MLVHRLSTPPRASEMLVPPIVPYCVASLAQRVLVDATLATEAAFPSGAEGTVSDVPSEGVVNPSVSGDGGEVAKEVPMDLQVTAWSR